MQFRQLDTFIHKDYLDSDLKYVKRFKETKLTKEQFLELVDYTRSKGLKTCSTAFDNESIPWFKELDISVVKVASCSLYIKLVDRSTIPFFTLDLEHIQFFVYE